MRPHQGGMRHDTVQGPFQLEDSTVDERVDAPDESVTRVWIEEPCHQH